MENKIMTAAEAAGLIKSGDYICISGFLSMGHPEELTDAVVKRFEETGEPRGVTVIAGAGMMATDRWAREGLTARLITTHVGVEPEFGKLIHSNKIEAYFLPYGPITHLVRAAAGKKPGILTKTGLCTFIDPRYGDGKMNHCSPRKMVEVMEIDGEEYLFYRTFPITVALIKGTTADEHGNISVEKEALQLDLLSMATAAKANNGIVIAQVERITKAATLHPKSVKVPGIIVDAIVVAKAENHWQSSVEPYNSALSGETRIPLGSLPALALDERKIIGRRVVLEMIPQSIINLGIGMPEGVAAVANEEGLADEMIAAIEAGPVGGVPQAAARFGSAMNPEALLDIGYQLDLFNAGVLNLAVLGLAEADMHGNVNVSKFGPRIVGAGGFIDITQNTKNVIFCGTMTAGDLKMEISEGKLKILNEGRSKKFVTHVGQITFSGDYARTSGQTVLFVTERAVFELKKEGLTLVEIAPGVDVEKHILQQMDFKPHIAKNLKIMDPRIFADKPMGIRKEILSKNNIAESR